MKDKTCCFTGRRKLDDLDKSKINNLLIKEIELLIKNEYKIFLVGGAIGFDTIAAIAIINLKKKYSDIKLHLVIPCPEYTKNWNADAMLLFTNIKNSCDKIIYTSDRKIRGSNHIRNRFLIDNSSVCIAYNNSDTGGTAYTVAYALKRNLKIINLYTK